jgi:hypothetical protein
MLLSILLILIYCVNNFKIWAALAMASVTLLRGSRMMEQKESLQNGQMHQHVHQS